MEEHLVRLQKFHCLICATSPKYNPRKPVYKAPKYCEWPNGPLEAWQMNFTLLPLTHGYKNVLVIVCIFHTLPGGSVLKNPPAMQEPQEMWVRSLGCENPLEKETHRPCGQVNYGGTGGPAHKG